jgi:hypothetical protein
MNDYYYLGRDILRWNGLLAMLGFLILAYGVPVIKQAASAKAREDQDQESGLPDRSVILQALIRFPPLHSRLLLSTATVAHSQETLVSWPLSFASR